MTIESVRRLAIDNRSMAFVQAGPVQVRAGALRIRQPSSVRASSKRYVPPGVHKAPSLLRWVAWKGAVHDAVRC